MRQVLISIVSLIILCVTAVAQRETGVGRPGGARSEQAESRDASLEAVNDSELKPYAVLISTDLRTNIRSTRSELERARKKVPNLPVDQFLATKEVARTYKLPVERLIKAIAPIAQSQTLAVATITKPAQNFDELLAKALHDIKPEIPENDAKDQARSALAKVNAARAE